ncbi:MAG: LysR family transcriptional regulator [Pseudomonadota bacterium]
MKTKNLTAITAVIQVAEEGSFAAASRALGLSTSATSKAIGRLEDELGVKLFHRTTRSVRMTPEGERYVEGVKPVLAELEAITGEITDDLAQPRGQLRISAPSALGRIIITPALSKFQLKYPELDIELSLDDREVDLASDPIDVAVRVGNLGNSASVVARKLLEDSLVICAAPSYLQSYGIPLTPADLTEHNCLNFRNRRTGRLYPWLFGTEETPNTSGRFISDDGEAVFRAALAGAGISQMPGFMAQASLARGELIEVLGDYRPPTIAISAIYLDRRLLSPRIRAFIDFMTSMYR